MKLGGTQKSYYRLASTVLPAIILKMYVSKKKKVCFVIIALFAPFT